MGRRKLSAEEKQECAQKRLAVYERDGKKCPRCQVVKSLDEYHRCQHKDTGIDTYCKDCSKELTYLGGWKRRIKRGGVGIADEGIEKLRRRIELIEEARESV